MSATPKRAIPIAEFTARIERRRAETGITDLPRNSGKRRSFGDRSFGDSALNYLDQRHYLHSG